MASAPHLTSLFTPRAFLRTLAGNVAFAFRHPMLFGQLFLRALRDPKARMRLLRLSADLETLRRSPLFDREWLLREHAGWRDSGIPVELLYLLHDVPDGRFSSARFSGDAYCEQNPELRDTGLNPLVHYEQYGRFIGCPASALDAESADPVFPEGAEEREEWFAEAPPRHLRTAVYATFSADGRLPERDVLYLRALREVADNVLLEGNSPLFPEELEKVRGLVSRACFRPHGGYDFGSYRRGLEAARERGWLEPGRCRELVFANSSCYAPVRPFAEMFGAMARRSADFWGVTQNAQVSETPHLQSYFLVFRRTVLEARALEAFFAERPLRASRRDAIWLFEVQLTDFLRRRGFAPDAFVRPRPGGLHVFNPTTRPLDLMRRHRMPMVKVKVFRGETSQPPEKVLAYVRRRNPELGAILRISPPAPPRWLSDEALAARRARTLGRIRERARAGEPVRMLFPVSNASMFPARPLFERACADPAFDARLAVVPDLRWPDRSPVADMEACERELSSAFPDRLLPPLRPDADGQWPDVLSGFDLVVFPSPYELSNYRYNPSRCVGADFLALHVNYGFFRSVYDRSVLALENYARFWKVFVECPASLEEFRAHAPSRGANAELVGYVKMDRLATCAPAPRRPGRPRVLVAPHHSIEGGANDALALSNFVRLSDFLRDLPARFPEIDFVLRPHPFLFRQLAGRRHWGPARTAAWKEAFLAHDNAFWSDEGDYFPEFAAADAIVQDCGSYLVEWLYTGKPCCYLLKGERDVEKFAPLGRECLRRCTLAYDAPDVERFLRDVVLGGRDDRAADREAFRRTVMLHYPDASGAALAAIRRELGLPAHFSG